MYKVLLILSSSNKTEMEDKIFITDFDIIEKCCWVFVLVWLLVRNVGIVTTCGRAGR